MKPYRAKDGTERLWINPLEIEDRMSGELEKAGLLPGLEEPVINLESFVEFHLRAQFDPYAVLEPTVLGETEFRPGANPKISINQDLTGAALDDDESQPGILGRWRATVAHEAAHVILHRCLFNLNQDQGSLFDGDDSAEPQAKLLQRCLKRDVMFRGSGGDWREIQANMGMAALLMPKAVFVPVFREEVERLGCRRVDRRSCHITPLVVQLAKRFKVSKQAAGIRLETLQLITQPGQADFLA
jgi:IrrE N-terminal-like domain